MKSPASTLVDYSLTAKVFHWLTAAIFVIQFPLGLVMVQMAPGAASDFIFSLHKSTGFFVLWLALLRLFYRLRSDIQRRESRLAGWHYRGTYIAHMTLYALLVLVPLTGWLGVSAMNSLDVFGIVKLPSILGENGGRAIWLLWAHALFAFGLIALVVIHVGFAMQGYLDGPAESAEEPDAPPPGSAGMPVR